jgi:hypothetical protein
MPPALFARVRVAFGTLAEATTFVKLIVFMAFGRFILSGVVMSHWNELMSISRLLVNDKSRKVAVTNARRAFDCVQLRQRRDKRGNAHELQ